ncbi:interferon epsilon [Cricetulus griseus]|uniref:Interferon epsilon n=1 Tax=Cricetulus griseus TaxID=10029 RepID=G3I0I6_CRIGR|nr:interferon epsilon [Cricetulus griseus]XP_027256150.1 interferon epsilon [Cricetulus griseus]EGV95214.1 Interferon epsilon [Cricetulus griseus]ERE86208.1 interferon epsilon-like protein [Cricetulus griseus]
MIHKQLPEMVLLLLASSTVFSLEPKSILFQSRMKRESLHLLKTLPISSVYQCLAHRKNFQLPWQSVSRHQYQKGHVLAVLHELLQQIFSLFQAHVSRGIWEENHIERVLGALHQQLEYVELLAGLKAESKSGGLSAQSLRLQIKSYFRRIHDYLENQRYSSCAWIVVQVEINRCMFFVFRLTAWLNKQETDP